MDAPAWRRVTVEVSASALAPNPASVQSLTDYGVFVAAVIVTGIGWFLLLLAGALYVGRRESVGVARAIEALSVRPIADLEDGVLAAITGVVERSGAPLVSPIDERAAARVEVEVERAGEPLFVHSEGRRVVLAGDGGGRVEVDLEGADLRVADGDRVDAPWSAEDRRALLRRYGADAPALTGEGRVRIKVLPLGEEVTAVGVARLEGGEARLSADAGVLFVTTASLSALAAELSADPSGLDRMMRIAAGLGVAALVVGLVTFLLT